MDEHVLVKFDGERRAVLVDGYENGRTNDPFRVETGTHTFSLKGPKNFSPEEETRVVKDTRPDAPFVVEFTRA